MGTLQQALGALFSINRSGPALFPDPSGQLDEDRNDELGVARALNAAFLVVLAGDHHPDFVRARSYLDEAARSKEGGSLARFYIDALDLIAQEVEGLVASDPDFAHRLQELASPAESPNGTTDEWASAEQVWRVFFPEGTGIHGREDEAAAELRSRRLVTVTRPNPFPIDDPAREILFTANALLTVPGPGQGLEGLPADMAAAIEAMSDEPQRYWYDHPVPIGIAPAHSEILHGLVGLDAAVAFEQARGNMESDVKATCVLSVSTTHHGLRSVAHRYLEHELRRHGGTDHLDVFAFTEADTRALLDEALLPAARRYLQPAEIEPLQAVFGVDGRYGRHYSFLKAIAALWSVLVDPNVRATFKIDLDQVFPHDELVAETGASAFEHFTTSRWGAQGQDHTGQPVELGMIAGTLVNERDIARSLFTPDVPFPDRLSDPADLVFFSVLPQALSTVAEMMTRYAEPGLDGITTCLERIHVTGGTNGILVDTLRRHRPFTPTFIGRAEDQAYILSVLGADGPRLAYVHEDGLIMRHDKAAFAAEAIAVAKEGQLIGDLVRILLFSRYAAAVTDDLQRLKDLLDPFTGCFVSKAPVTVTHLRFAQMAASMFAAGEDDALQFITSGAPRIAEAVAFTRGAALGNQLDQERLGWTLYYDTLDAWEEALSAGDSAADELRSAARRIITGCRIG